MNYQTRLDESNLLAVRFLYLVCIVRFLQTKKGTW